MYLVLAFSLILAFLSIGQSYSEGTDQTSTTCHAVCPAGYHKYGHCDDPAAQLRCKKCEDHTFTDRKNSIESCEKCGSCGLNQVETKRCSFNSDVECDCKEGYYNAGFESTSRHCVSCPQGYKNPEKKNNRILQDCRQDPECKRICLSTANLQPTIATTPTFMTTATAASMTAVKHLPLLSFLLVAVVILWLMLLLFRQDRSSCYSINNSLETSAEDPKFNERHSHQDCSAATVTFNISEETPMITLSQSPAHPAHISPPPDAEHKSARYEEQSEHWPATVLYAIIREVPLRRWKEFLRLLSVADQQLERVELEAGLGLGFTERQYQMLRLWSQSSSARLSDVFSALHSMDLSGCAQLLQENLEKVQW